MFLANLLGAACLAVARSVAPAALVAPHAAALGAFQRRMASPMAQWMQLWSAQLPQLPEVNRAALLRHYADHARHIEQFVQRVP